MTTIDPEARAVVVRSAAAKTLGNPDRPPLCGCSPTPPPPGGALSAQRVFLGRGAEEANLHRHTGSSELLHVLDGSAQILAGTKVVTMQQGDFAVVPPHLPHAFAATADSGADLLIMITPGRPPAFRRADMLRAIDAGLNGGNKGVLHAAQPDGIPAALLAGSSFLSQDGSVVGHAPEQPQDAIFVYHELPAPVGDTGRELPVRAGDARELVEVTLPGGSLPPDPADGIIIEEQPAAGRYPPSQFQRSVIKDQEVHARRQQDIEGVRRLAAEVRRDVDVRTRRYCPEARLPCR